METVTLRHRSLREISRCNPDPTNPTPAAAREKRSPEGNGAAQPHSRSPYAGCHPRFPPQGWVAAGVEAVTRSWLWIENAWGSLHAETA